MLLCLFALLAKAQTAKPSRLDSVQHLGEVIVLNKSTYQETIPSQRLNGEEIERLNSHSVADALRYFSGLQIKDYGGIGGIKTVNIRSMGTNHLGIFYDGIEVGNAQNGQVDLGQFSLDNVEEITLYNGQKSAIFQPASDFGNAGSVYIRTRVPKFSASETCHLKGRLRYGSSDMIMTSVLYEQRLSSSLCSSINAEVLNASGKYKFRYRRKNIDGTTAYDTTAVRHNGDITAVRVEGNLHGLITHGSWYMKMYSYNSERGIPGAIVNNVWRRGERQWDHNSFAQMMFQRGITNWFNIRLLAKYAYYDTRYVNNDTTQMHVDNRYKQQELYLSSANVVEITPWWSASLSYDFKWNKLNSDVPDFVYPHRFTNMLSLATAIDGRIVKIQGSILANIIKDHVRKGDETKAIKRLTPALFVNVYPFSSKDFSVRVFAKRSFRMPTFNDLYYADMGNSRLKPETATQYDAGFLYAKTMKNKLINNITVQADAYYNTLHDKIIAYPKGQQFRWTMLNLGRVHITGVDIEASATMTPCRQFAITGRLQYTYQDAKDVTDASTSYYNDQIPYIPWNSGSAILGITYRNWDLNYSFIYTGERYSQRENIAYNHLQPWYTSDMSIMYRFMKGKTSWKITMEINNLFSQDYDVILNYPMPKRNYAVSLDISI
jgi:outer membrane cobalamin receptor